MADMKLADLTAGTADGTDIVYAVKDPSGTPLDRKLTLSTVKDYITGAANLFTTAQTISPLTDVQGLTVRGGPAGTVNILQLQDSANNLLVAFDKDGLLTLGRGSGLTGQLKFSNSTNNNLVTLQAGTTSGNITFTLPTADGTSGQVLQTNGSGVLSWKTDATNSPGGSDTQVQFNNSGSFGGNAALTFGSNTLTIGTPSTTTGILSFGNASSGNATKIQGGNASSSVTYTLPTADGSNGQVLSTNGSGTLSWKTDATTSPAGSDTQLQFNNSGSFGADSTLTFNSISKQLTAQRFGLSGNISSAAWTTSGIRYSNASATITDTSSSGTVATAYTNVYGGNTIAASNSTTFTNYYNTYIAAPVSGTNVTFTNAWALGLGGAAQIAAGTLNGTVLDISQAWSGTGTYTGIKYNVSSDAGPANTASLLLDLQVGGSSKFKVRKDGRVDTGAGVILGGDGGVYAAATGWFQFSTSRSGLYSTTDGNITLTNSSSGGFNLLIIGGGTASSNPALKRSSTSLQIKLGDDSAYTQLDAGTLTLSTDVIFTRRGAANLRLGAADAAAPVAQTLSVQSVVAGTTNTAGTNFTITGSQGTGTGAGGDIIFQTAAAGSSGTSQNALATALTINSAAQSLFANGTLTNPSISFGAETNSGFYRSANNICNLSIGGSRRIVFAATLIGFALDQELGWYSSNFGVFDTILRRRGTANVQLGAADAASPVAQTLSVQGATGTDTAGATFTTNGSTSTGTGAGGNLVRQTAFSAKSTGSTANTLIARDVIVAKGKVLTDATATSLFEVALPTLTMCGGTIRATTVCTDGTDMQSVTEVITFSAVNKGGVYTTDIDVGTTSSAISGGTLANTWTVLTGTNKITIQLSSDTSLTPSANSFLVYYQISNNSEQDITVV